MKKQKVKRFIKQAVKDTYGKAGYTNTADKMLTILFKEIEKHWK